MSDGYCEVDFTDGDFEPCEAFDAGDSVATEPLVCSECDGPIAVGETYRWKSYRLDGEDGEDRQCAICREIAGEFGHHLTGSCLWKMFHNEWENGAHIQACIQRVGSVAAKERMRQQWLKWKGLA